MDRIAKGFSDEETRAIAAWYAAAEVGGARCSTSRRQFLKAASAAALLPMPAIAQGAGPKVVVIGGGFAGASAARFVKKGNRAIARDAGRGEPDVHRLPVLQRRDRRPARVARAAIQLRQGRATPASRSRSSRRPAVDAQAKSVTLAQRHEASLRPARDGARHRPALGRPARLHRARGRHHAARLEGGRADAAAAQPARIDGGRRHRGHLGAGQSVPLPARPLRAREPDRALPEDQKAEVEGHHPRRQGRLLQAAPVPERLEGALSRITSNGCRCRRAAR